MKKNNLWNYIFSKDFWNQVKLALAIFFGIILIINIYLHFFTHHNSTHPVPDFKGLSIRQALELAEDNNLRIQIMDSVFNLAQKPGTVVDQEPKAGFRVKKNRRIFLVMNAFIPEKVKMPDVAGVSLRQAIAILESNGLLTGRLRYVHDIATNNVLKQRYKGKEIKPGTQIFKGSHIDFTLGRSDNAEQSQIPDLTGLSFNEAEKKISLSCLNLGIVDYDNSVKTLTDSLNAAVFRQKPGQEKLHAAMGTVVDIWLTIDKKKIKTNSVDKDEKTSD